MEGKVKPQYGRVVDIVTTPLSELLSLAIIAIFTPVAVGS